jgi:ribosomal protein S10
MSRQIRIELASHDPQLVDGATSKIARFIDERHAHTPMPIPLPARTEQFGEEVSQRVHPRAVDVRAVNTELIVQLQQLQLPEGVEVSIKQPG